jgi:uncharacterized membrane protein YeiB
MFGLLFAYGIGQLHARRIAAGSSERDVRRLLRTRHRWLLAFGLVHAALLWQGDILATYGVLGLLLVPLCLHRSDRTLKIWIGVLLAVGAVGNVALTALGQLLPAAVGAMDLQQQAIAEPDYLASVVLRLVLWVPAPFSSLVGLVMPAAFLIGILAARHRVLDEPGRHLPLLRRTAVLGLALGRGAGAVQALIHLGVLVVPNPSATASAGVVHPPGDREPVHELIRSPVHPGTATHRLMGERFAAQVLARRGRWARSTGRTRSLAAMRASAFWSAAVSGSSTNCRTARRWVGAAATTTS